MNWVYKCKEDIKTKQDYASTADTKTRTRTTDAILTYTILANQIWDYLPSGGMAPDPISFMRILLRRQIAAGHTVKCTYAPAPSANTSDSSGCGSSDSDEEDGSRGSSRVPGEPSFSCTIAIAFDEKPDDAYAQPLIMKVPPSRPWLYDQTAG
jgi:hypothetical protein